MRIIIAGGRIFNDYNKLKSEFIIILQQLATDGLLYGSLTIDAPSIEIVSGCANGADKLGDRLASEYNIKVKQFPAKWDNLESTPCKVKYNSYGKPYNALAGLSRNKMMAEYAKEDNGVLIACWNGSSYGTKNMIYLAKKNGLRVFVINY